MFEVVLSNILILSGVAFLSALVLYFVSKKFAVVEDPRIDEVEACLPAANCGACGKLGCRDFAKACVVADIETFSGLYCPVGGEDTMQKVAAVLGFKAVKREKTIAVLKCQGTCENAPDKIVYTGLDSCALASRVSVGSSGCPNGCLRFGDCTKVCKFDALRIGLRSGLPEVDEKKCTSCGACVGACPRGLFEIRLQGVGGKRTYVACSNQQKGAVARKNCKVACIACQKCAKLSDLIKIENNLSYIPAEVDAVLLGKELSKCCPTGAIVYTGKNHD